MLREFVPDFTIIAVPSFKATPALDGTNTETFILLNFDQRVVLIGNSEYGGEINQHGPNCWHDPRVRDRILITEGDSDYREHHAYGDYDHS